MFYQFEHFGLSEYTHKEYGENFNFPSHLHQSFEFVTVLSGKMEITVDNRVHRLNAGESLLIFPNQIHSFSCTEGKHMLFIFSAELVKVYSSQTFGKMPCDNSFSPDEYLVKALDKMSDNSSVIEKKGLLYLLCAQFDKQAKYLDRTDDDKNLLYKIFKFVELGYAGNCSLGNVSEKTGFSYSYLSRYFKRIVGMSYNEYVNRYRISNACYLLTNTNNSILQCALDSGYNSLRSFNRNFADILSITPNEYRDNAKRNRDKA